MFKYSFSKVLFQKIESQIFCSSVRKLRLRPLNKSMEDYGNKPCKVASLDHLVLTVANIEKSITFYTKGLGMNLVTFGEGRKALQFGRQKINLHQKGKEFKPYAKTPTPGSADLCFVTEQPLQNWIAQLTDLEIKIVEGPVQRTGALGPIRSIYVRDPDGNLVEISTYGNKN